MGGGRAKSAFPDHFPMKRIILLTILPAWCLAHFQRSRIFGHLHTHHRTLIQYIRHTGTNIWCVVVYPDLTPPSHVSHQPVAICPAHVEIQELRHKSQGSSDTSGANNEIDQLLINLDERLDTVSKGIKAVTDALEPLLSKTPVPSGFGVDGEVAAMIRKHAALMAEWEAAKSESETLRDELKEDKWLIVFRTVTEQAGGLMSSLEKGVNRCQVRLTP